MRIPYGFTLTNNGTLEISRSEADNVALVFDLYMAGASLGKVADSTNICLRDICLMSLL